MTYYARKIEENGRALYQTIQEHAEHVAILCGQFVGQFSDSAIGKTMGYLHDIGKYSVLFQRRIRGEKISTSHARAGALECERWLQESDGRNFLYRLIGMAICGHHGGLMNYGSTSQDGSYHLRMRRTDDVEDYAAWKKERLSLEPLDLRKWGIKPRLPSVMVDQHSRGGDQKKLLGFQIQLYGRFLFSSLVDADRLDAQNFPYGEAERYMASCASLADLKTKLDIHMEELQAKADVTPLNTLRAGILADCLAAADGKPGLYSITVPTGGGKTLASMAFTLRHALGNRQRRVIYAIPFMSIIEQNAKVFANIFGRRNVLEHHSNFDLPENETDAYDSERYAKLKLAQENWYEPIIITTNVQFFESLFSHKAGKVRKLHNIAGSVIILDEAQSIPKQYVLPCMEVLNELVENYGCTVVLCTATQPEFDRNRLFLSKVDIKEIIGDVPLLFDQLRRTTPVYLGKQTLDQITLRLKGEKQALCIVNTKKHARELFQQIVDKDGAYHLSTNLYPAHRKAVLEEIRQRLHDKLPCLVVSTQLIEAGVDIDFPVVYRATAGVDSLVQAAGRCNREGKLETGRVYVFDPEETYQGKGHLALTAGIGRMIAEAQPQFLETSAVRAYFHDLFDITRDALDQKDIFGTCANSIFALSQSYPDMQIEYEEISKKFEFIENEGYSVIIEANTVVSDLLEKTKYVKSIGPILRELSAYAVNVRGYELQKLCDLRSIRQLDDGIYVLADTSLYNKKYGFTLEATDQEDYIV